MIGRKFGISRILLPPPKPKITPLVCSIRSVEEAGVEGDFAEVREDPVPALARLGRARVLLYRKPEMVRAILKV